MRRAPIAILLAVSWQCAGAPPQRAASQAGGVRVTSFRMARVPPPGVHGPQVTVETENDFLTTDGSAWILATYTGGRQGDNVRVEWRNPEGALLQQQDYAQQLPNIMRVTSRLLIAGGPASSAPGQWQVRVFWKDRQIGAADFKISAPPQSVVNINRQGLVPAGTVSVPYHLQLTARGGTPPYQWSSSNALPDGLTLSPTGVISGSPAKRGSYRILLEARDSAGNSVVRAVGMAVGEIAPNARSSVHQLLKAAGSDACAHPSTLTEFSVADDEVVLAATLQAPGGREGRVEWLNPLGDIALLNRIAKPADARQCVVTSLPVASHRPALPPGDWRVRLLWNDMEVFTLPFTLAAAKGAPPPVTAAEPTAGRGAGRGARAAANAAAANTAPPGRSGRIALVIGNLHYDKLAAPEMSAVGDADPAAGLDHLEMALRQGGFQVIRKSDVNLENLRSIERTLNDSLQAGDTALVYYTGYDIRSGGDDWLLPVNFDAADSRPLQAKAYSTLRLLQMLEDSKASLRFIFLNAAAAPGQQHENPGAVMGEVDDSTALVYSSAPGVNAKAAGLVFPVFTRALAEVLALPGMDARTALQIELPKAVARRAAGAPSPMAILGGGAEFVFHPVPARGGR